MKSVFLKSFLVPVLVSVFSSSFCQKNFLPGYVIQNGDTLKGFIDYRNWRVNPDAISFRRDLNSDERVFAPLEIDGFAVHDERYASAGISKPGYTTTPAVVLPNYRR